MTAVLTSRVPSRVCSGTEYINVIGRDAYNLNVMYGNDYRSAATQGSFQYAALNGLPAGGLDLGARGHTWRVPAPLSVMWPWRCGSTGAPVVLPDPSTGSLCRRAADAGDRLRRQPHRLPCWACLLDLRLHQRAALRLAALHRGHGPGLVGRRHHGAPCRLCVPAGARFLDLCKQASTVMPLANHVCARRMGCAVGFIL